MRNFLVCLLACAVAGSVLGGVGACGSSDESAGGPFGDARAPDSGSPDGTVPFGDAGVGSIIDVNALVIVHAASFPAFRICFTGTPDELPMPTFDLLPESNVVGVDVGTAVRLPPPTRELGKAFIFPESVLRPYYPMLGMGPTCSQVLNSSGTSSAAIAVGEVVGDVSHGVHALVLGGCRRASEDPVASTDRCGSTWNATDGNLKLSTISLTAYGRLGDTRFPVQLVQLSPGLDRRASGRALGIAFGSLDAGTPPAPFVEGAVPFGQAVPNPPAVLDYTGTDLGSYATSGVFVTLGADLDDAGMPLEAGVDAGAREIVFTQSLADIQRRSAPRSLPPDWFSVASSYVVLSVGDPDPRLADGGPDDDTRHALHLLAIPLATPDTGMADAGP